VHAHERQRSPVVGWRAPWLACCELERSCQLDPEQILAISRPPARDVLYGQLVGLAASPITGLVRGLNALIAGLAIQLGQIAEKKEKGEIPAGEPPAGMAASEAEAGAPEAGTEGEATPADEAAAPKPPLPSRRPLPKTRQPRPAPRAKLRGRRRCRG
jgi:large subunit ribosomal protein L10